MSWWCHMTCSGGPACHVCCHMMPWRQMILFQIAGVDRIRCHMMSYDVIMLSWWCYDDAMIMSCDMIPLKKSLLFLLLYVQRFYISENMFRVSVLYIYIYIYIYIHSKTTRYFKSCDSCRHPTGMGLMRKYRLRNGTSDATRLSTMQAMTCPSSCKITAGLLVCGCVGCNGWKHFFGYDERRRW